MGLLESTISYLGIEVDDALENVRADGSLSLSQPESAAQSGRLPVRKRRSGKRPLGKVLWYKVEIV